MKEAAPKGGLRKMKKGLCKSSLEELVFCLPIIWFGIPSIPKYYGSN
jgi:hypothetical protein